MIRPGSAVHRVRWDTWGEALTQYWALCGLQKNPVNSGSPFLGSADWAPSICRLLELQGLVSRKGISKSWRRGNYEGCERSLWKVNLSLLWWRLAKTKSWNGMHRFLGPRQVTGMGSLSVISETLLEAIRSYWKSFPGGTLEFSDSRGY